MVLKTVLLVNLVTLPVDGLCLPLTSPNPSPQGDFMMNLVLISLYSSPTL